MKVSEIFVIRVSFFKIRMSRTYFELLGKNASCERKIIFIVGRKTNDNSLRGDVGILSTSQLVSGD